jgi:Flp pilus assembly protein TadD
MGRNRGKTAEQHKAEGNELYKEGKLEEACRSYEAAMQLEPGLAVYASNKSACLFELGR